PPRRSRTASAYRRHVLCSRPPRPPSSTLFPYATLFRSINPDLDVWCDALQFERLARQANMLPAHDARAEDLRRKAVALYRGDFRSEEHTSELQSRENLVCRLLLEKKNTQTQDRAASRAA